MKSGGLYVMWLSGVLNNVTGIFTARSTDGVNWKNFTLVLRPGLNGSWDELVYSPSVIWNGSTYLMYYTGTGTDSYRQIGLAYSRDNTNWVKYAHNPILTAGPGIYDSWWGRFADVMLDNGVYKTWYTGHTLTNTSTPWYTAVDYATSMDGVHWTKYPGNPVYGAEQWLAGNPVFYEHPSVIKVDQTYVMIAGPNEIGYATSPDGIRWTQGNGVLIAPGTNSSWDGEDVRLPSALLNGTQILVWYTGYGANLQEGIGLAACSFLFLPTVQTTTTTSTIVSASVATSTASSVSTVLSTEYTTQSQTVTASGPYLISTAGGVALLATGAVLGGLVAAALARRRRFTTE